LGRGILKKKTALELSDGFQSAAFAQRDDRTAGRHRFHRHNPKIFFPWKYQRLAALVMGAEIVVRHPPPENHLRPGQFSERPAFLTFADDDEFFSETPERFDSHFDALIRRQRADDKIKRIFYRRVRDRLLTVKIDVDRWVNHG